MVSRSRSVSDVREIHQTLDSFVIKDIPKIAVQVVDGIGGAGDAAEHQALEAAASMGAEDGEVRPPLLQGAQDRVAGVAGEDPRPQRRGGHRPCSSVPTNANAPGARLLGRKE
jgi:hypothetical protein